MDPNNPIDVTPEMIANHIFSNDPQPPGSIQLLADDDEMDMEFIFEVLMTVLMEGFKLMTETIDEVTVNTCTSEHFEILGQWIRSMGFDLNVEDIVGEFSNSSHYCKVYLNNQQNEGFFYHTNIADKLYHFVISSDQMNKDRTSINEFVAVIPLTGKYIKVTFSMIDESSSDSETDTESEDSNDSDEDSD